MPRRNRLPRPVRVGLAFAAALVLWFALAGFYHRALGTAAAALFPSRGAGAVAILADRESLLVGPVEHPRARAAVPMAIVTSNLVLFAALAAWDPSRPGRGRFARLGVALLVLAAGHLLAVVAAIHSSLAVSLSEWTGDRYGAIGTNAWFVLWQGYQVVGAWGLAFGAWWWARGETAP